MRRSKGLLFGVEEIGKVSRWKRLVACVYEGGRDWDTESDVRAASYLVAISTRFDASSVNCAPGENAERLEMEVVKYEIH